MPNSRTWSITSAPCRIERRASPWQAGAFALLGLLAGISVMASAMPAAPAGIVAITAVLYGARLGWRELRARPMCLTFSQYGEATVDGESVSALRVRWRGPIVFLRWNDACGRARHRVGTPDVFDRATRRRLRLAGSAHASVRGRPSVAP